MERLMLPRVAKERAPALTRAASEKSGRAHDSNRCSGIILYYTILYYTILYYTILYYTILYYTIPYHTILY